MSTKTKKQQKSHTPGPWKIEEDFGGIVGVTAADGDLNICQMSDAENAEEVMADARLIAASPKLLAALQQVKAKVLTQHNFLSTATDQERRDPLEHLIDWWNGDVVPLLAKIKG